MTDLLHPFYMLLSGHPPVNLTVPLQVRKRAARTGRNPQTGEPIKIKASKIAFRPAKELKEAVKPGAAIGWPK